MNDNIKLKKCSLHFTYNMLFHCGETWSKLKPYNLPKQKSSWLAYQSLAIKILDPMVDMFGLPIITYGFCSSELKKNITKKTRPNISPSIDQHASCELNSKGSLICSRKGAAIDIFYPNISSFEVATWLASNTPFDRLYVYGDVRPLHLSYGPDNSRKIVLLENINGRQIPKKINLEQLKGMSKC